MARKKTNKRSKPQPAARATANIALVKLEKSFHQLPLKLATMLNKEVLSLKKKQLKLKNAIDKLSIQIKKSEKRVMIASKVQGTAGKRQQKVAQKKLNDMLKTQQVLNQQWEKSATNLNTTTATHAKFVALNKHLDSFEKEWANQSKPIKTSKVKSQTEKKPTRTKTAVVEDTQNEATEANVVYIKEDVNNEETETSEMTS
jgi:hypothetical protein